MCKIANNFCLQIYTHSYLPMYKSFYMDWAHAPCMILGYDYSNVHNMCKSWLICLFAARDAGICSRAFVPPSWFVQFVFVSVHLVKEHCSVLKWLLFYLVINSICISVVIVFNVPLMWALAIVASIRDTQCCKQSVSNALFLCLHNCLL
jgi:hypothetical protein